MPEEFGKSAMPENPGESFRPPSALRDLEQVRTPEGVAASADYLFANAIFGRDSIEVAYDLYRYKPEIAKDVIFSLLNLQGRKADSVTAEEPGRIHHEARRPVVEDSDQARQSNTILERLKTERGITTPEYVSYTSVDATPLFVRMACAYLKEHGDSLSSTQKQELESGIVAAVGWIEQRINSSDLALIESLPPQHAAGSNGSETLLDGRSVYIHPSGERFNESQPLASPEVQAYAVDALRGAADLLAATPGFDAQAQRWVEEADLLQRRTLELFWMPEEGYFAMGIDRNESGTPRQIRSQSLNPAMMLDTSLFDGLNETEDKRYVGGIIEHIYSNEFMTPVGLRTKALRHAGATGYTDYQGAWTVWYRVNYDVARGLQRQGFGHLADQIKARLLNGINLSQGNYEFAIVDPSGEVHYDVAERLAGERRVLAATNVPEAPQAWTVSLALAIKKELDGRARASEVPEVTEGWRGDLETESLRRVPDVQIMKWRSELLERFQNTTLYHIDTDLGKQAEATRYPNTGAKS